MTRPITGIEFSLSLLSQLSNCGYSFTVFNRKLFVFFDVIKNEERGKAKAGIVNILA